MADKDLMRKAMSALKAADGLQDGISEMERKLKAYMADHPGTDAKTAMLKLGSDRSVRSSLRKITRGAESLAK